MGELSGEPPEERNAPQILQVVRAIPQGAPPHVLLRQALRRGREGAIDLARGKAADLERGQVRHAILAQ